MEPLTGLRAEQVPLLVRFLDQRPGANTVILRLANGDVTSVRKSSLCPDDEAELSMAIGAVYVTYDTDSVDLGEVEL